MNKIVVVALSLLLISCATQGRKHFADSKPKDQIDEEMLVHLKVAAEKQKIGDVVGAIDEYNFCIRLKPRPEDISTSQPRRWCQNNVVNIMLSCNLMP